MQGWASTVLPEAGSTPENASVEPLLDTIVRHIPPPADTTADPFAMLVAMVEHDSFLGRVATGRVAAGKAKVGDRIRVLHHTGGPAHAASTRCTSACDQFMAAGHPCTICCSCLHSHSQMAVHSIALTEHENCSASLYGILLLTSVNLMSLCKLSSLALVLVLSKPDLSGACNSRCRYLRRCVIMTKGGRWKQASPAEAVSYL